MSTTKTSSRRVAGGEHALVVAGEQDALDAEREADAGRGRAAERLDQAVVAAAAADAFWAASSVPPCELERSCAV